MSIDYFDTSLSYFYNSQNKKIPQKTAEFQILMVTNY